MTTPTKSLPLPSQANSNLGYESFQQRKTQELFFAFVEPIGGGAKDASKILEQILSSEYGYKINTISLSNLLKNETEHWLFENPEIHPDLQKTITSQQAYEINKLQQYGNILRKHNGNDYLARKAICKIAQHRIDNGGIEQAHDAAPVPKSLKTAHIILSIKHLDEYNLLKAVYGNLLLLVAVSSSFKDQAFRFRPHNNTTKQQEQILKEYQILSKIDQDEGITNGQQVREVFHKADLFLNNSDQQQRSRISTLLQLLFGKTIKSPTKQESMMFEAFAASLRSTCLSRQVGAAIADQNHELVSVGWNDVPAFGGGLAHDECEKSQKALCKNKGSCRSNTEINNLLSRIEQDLKSNGILKKGTKPKAVHDVLKNAGLKNLIEFSRAIHAEMEAILSAARTAKRGLKGATLYVTTYPCDNCAKHILAAGIKKVVYIEPYPKSRAEDFFGDFIGTEISDEGSKLIFTQFVGIAPQTYSLLFRKWYDRKGSDGSASQAESNIPIVSVYLDSYTLYEAQIAREYHE